MKTIIFFIVMIMVNNVFAQDCSFKKAQLDKVRGKEVTFKVKSYHKLIVENPNEEVTLFEGPVWIKIQGKKVCEVPPAGNISGLFVSNDKNYFMIEEYSGSTGQYRVFDVMNCKEKGTAARYVGETQVLGQKIMNEPACEKSDEDKKVGYCSSARIYKVLPKSCQLKLDEEASKKLTLEKLGVELSFEKSQWVTGIGTSQAQIINK